MSTVRTSSLTLSAALPRAGVRAGVRGFVAVTLAGLVLALPARATAEDQAILDLRRTIRAQQALERDPVLGPLKLLVIVHHGVAYLEGPVPAPEFAARAVACLRQLPELSGVRNKLFLDPWAEPPGTAPMHTPPWRRASRSEEGKRPPPLAWAPSPVAAPAPRPSAKPPEASTVVPSVRVPVPPPASSGLAEVVRRLQRSQKRFQRLHVEVQGAHVYLSGAALTWDDLYELSDEITRLPGVAGVTFRAIRIDPAPR